MPKEKFNPKAFSLWLTCGKYKKNIEIPIMKKGVNYTPVGGKQTYLMAIDAFTTQFADYNELIDYIRDNNLARIKSADNDEIDFKITYNGPYPFSGNLSLIFNNNNELVNFINVNQIKDYFHFSHKILFVLSVAG